MATTKESIIIQAPVNILFDVIYDLESYPIFIPWCSGAGYLSGDNNDKQQQNSTRRAYLEIGIGFASYKIITNNTAFYPNRISLSLDSGPLSKLTGQWLIEKIDDNQSKISMDMDFKWQSGFVGMALEKSFNLMNKSLVGIFKDRVELLAKP